MTRVAPEQVPTREKEVIVRPNLLKFTKSFWQKLKIKQTIP